MKKKLKGVYKFEQMFEISFKEMPVHCKSYQEYIFKLIHMPKCPVLISVFANLRN